MIKFPPPTVATTTLGFLLPQSQGLSVFAILNRRSAFAAIEPANPPGRVAVDFPSAKAMVQAARLKSSHEQNKHGRSRNTSRDDFDDDEDEVQAPVEPSNQRYVRHSPGLGVIGSPKPTGSWGDNGFEPFRSPETSVSRGLLLAQTFLTTVASSC